MRPSTRPRSAETARVLTRWRGMGAVIAVAFYSLFFSAHLTFQETPIYVRDGLIFSARTQTIFNNLVAERTGYHRSISAQHPGFVVLHQPLASLFTQGWSLLGQDQASARKHGVAVLTCLAGALSVVMIYHTLLWSGMATLRAILLSMIFGASTCVWIMAPLPEVWTFTGLSIVSLVAATVRGSLLHPAWHIAASVYAMSCFAGNLIPCLIMATTRCAEDLYQQGRFNPRPLIICLIAFTLSFGLANIQQAVYPNSSPLPKSWKEWQSLNTGWKASRETQALVAREVFVSNIVAPPFVTTQVDVTRSKVVISRPIWAALDLRKGVSTGWLLILSLAFAGLVWRAQIEPLTLGVIAILMWSIASIGWYGSQDTLLLHACRWTGLVVVAAGLGLERALAHWSKLSTPVTFFLAIFVSALITRNWMFIQEVAAMPGK